MTSFKVISKGVFFEEIQTGSGNDKDDVWIYIWIEILLGFDLILH